jgi:hypothetical protein
VRSLVGQKVRDRLDSVKALKRHHDHRNRPASAPAAPRATATTRAKYRIVVDTQDDLKGLKILVQERVEGLSKQYQAIERVRTYDQSDPQGLSVCRPTVLRSS